ncbi:MAG: hypothetical protein M3348_19435 [Acidobacteriota bacterium]|nr:hypothetical protein [Acidobacteriota bacterium]
MSLGLYVFLVLVWIGCGLVARAMLFAFFQKTFPELADEHREEDWWRATLLITVGPVTLLSLALFYHRSDLEFQGALWRKNWK